MIYKHKQLSTKLVGADFSAPRASFLSLLPACAELVEASLLVLSLSKHRSIEVSLYHHVKSSNHQNVTMSNFQIFKSSNFQILK